VQVKQVDTGPIVGLTETDAKTVRRAQIFRGVEDSDVGALLGRFRVVPARPHAEIFHQGDEPGG
jgi:hypothetical protein